MSMVIKIKYKIFILFFTLIIVLLLIIYYQINKITENNFYKYLKNKIEKSELALNNYISSLLEKYLKETKILISSDELNYVLDNNLTLNIPLVIKKIKKDSNFDSIQLYNQYGQLLINEGQNLGIETKEQIRYAINTKTYSGLYLKNKKILFITYMPTKKNNYIFCGKKIFDDKIADDINNILDINFILFNDDLIQSANIFFKNIISKENFKIDPELTEKAKNGIKTFIIPKNYSSVFYYIPFLDHNSNIIGQSIISFDSTLLLSIRKQTQSYLLKILIIALIITFIFVLLFSEQITTPIKKITKWAKIISEGNLSHREKIKTHDEINELAKVFTLMLDNLEQSMNKINQKNKELTQANIKLMELDKMKNDFLAGISHELKTPLTSINGFIKIMRKKMEKNILPYLNIENEKIRNTLYTFFDNMKIIEIEANKLTEVILNLIDFVSIEAGKVEWNIEIINIRELIDEIIKEKSSLIQKKELEVIINVDEDSEKIAGDRKYFKKLLNHLITNAINFTDNGYIKIETKIQDNNWIFSIKDTGPGIPKEFQEVIFEKFRQLGDMLIYKPHGLGIGLPLCRSIVEHYDGKIYLESNPGEGSKFIVSIPLNMKY